MKMATRTYSIKFNFEAEEPQELSVSEGELVRAPGTLTDYHTDLGMCCTNLLQNLVERADQSQEPWTLVETVAPPFNRGFVPTSYLIPVSPAAEGALQQHGEEEEEEVPYTEYLETAREGGPVRRLSDPRLPHQLLEVLSINPPEEHLPVSSAAANTSNSLIRPLNTSQSYQHLFAQHDRQFQQVMHMRHEQFKALEEAASDLTRRIEAAKQKSSEIADTMLDITGIIEGERKRWKDKLSEQISSYQAL